MDQAALDFRLQQIEAAIVEMAKRNGIVNELLDSQTQRYHAHEIKPQSAHALALMRALAAALRADGAG